MTIDTADGYAVATPYALDLRERLIFAFCLASVVDASGEPSAADPSPLDCSCDDPPSDANFADPLAHRLSCRFRKAALGEEAAP